MNRFKLLLVCCLPIGMAGCDSMGRPAGSGETENKLVGVWTAVKAGGKELPEDHQLIMEFTKDNRLITRDSDDEEETTEEGDYKVEGNTITADRIGNKKGDTYTIKKLEGDLLILHDAQKNIDYELSRKK